MRMLRIRRSAPSHSVGLNRALLRSPLDFFASRARPFGFESLRVSIMKTGWAMPILFSLAETVGFEPTVPREYTAFRVRLVIATSIRLLICFCRRRDYVQRLALCFSAHRQKRFYHIWLLVSTVILLPVRRT